MFEELGLAITDPVKRLQAIDHRWRMLYQIAEERSQWPECQGVPGWKSGFMVQRIKSLGRAGSAKEYETDYTLLNELRMLEEAARRECGQGSDGSSSSAQASVNVVVCSVTERDQVIAAREELKLVSAKKREISYE